MKQCECGCGLETNVGRDSKKYNRFLPGHNFRKNCRKEITEETREKMKEKRKGRKPNLGNKHSKEFCEKMRELGYKRKANLGRIFSEEWKNNLRKHMTGRKNHHKKEYKDKLKEEMLNGRASNMCSKNTNPSKPQVELYKLVKIVDPYPILNFAIPKINRVADIALPSRKISIEYDEPYWHDKKKDKERDKLLASVGWKTIRYERRIPSMKELINDIYGDYNV